jgi:hypothetical protein
MQNGLHILRSFVGEAYLRYRLLCIRPPVVLGISINPFSMGKSPPACGNKTIRPILDEFSIKTIITLSIRCQQKSPIKTFFLPFRDSQS